MVMHPRLRSLLVFLLLLAGSFITYYYGLADYPRRDHGGYLAERVLLETDWDWFWHSVSFSRTRFLHPGDYYLFRPLHMAVLALKDIFFRNNLFALGAINITMMAVAAFSLYLFSSRLLKPTVAFIVALLFMVQYAGLEMVAWGHISSYLLALAFFGFAMTSLFEAGPDNKAALKKAGIFLLLGALVHEMVVVALVFMVPVLFFIRWRAGKGAEIGGIPLRSYILWVVAVPVLVYLGLDLFDYLYHGAPPLFSATGDSISGERFGPLRSIFTVAGASAIAFIAPYMVELVPGTRGTFAWNFEAMHATVFATGAVTCVAVMICILWCIRTMRKGRGTTHSLNIILTLLLFVGIVLGLGLGRVYLRGVSYLLEAIYYYSITAYIFCLLLAIGIHHLNKVKGRIPLLLSRAVLVVMVLFVAVNFAKTREALSRDWPVGKTLARMYPVLDRSLAEHSDRYCLAGILPGRIDTYMGLFPQLFWKQTCQKEDRRIPGYLVASQDGSLWLSELKENPANAFGEPQEVHFWRPKPNFLLSRESFDKPDIAVTVHNKAHIFLIFGYQSIENYFYIELHGPLLYCRIITGGEQLDLIRYIALPYVKSDQRLEVRHGTGSIYIFANDHLVAYIPEHNRGTGKVGIIVREANVDINQVLSDFVVAPSAPEGEEIITLKPVAQLLEKPNIAFPNASD